PDIVFFGEPLPEHFFANVHVPEHADLCIVMGTSLSVQPFAGLPSYCRERTPRLLINLTEAGDLGSRADDVLLRSDCDAGVRRLARACGWEADLQALWEQINPAKATAEKEGRQAELRAQSESSRDALLAEIEHLTAEVDETLSISRDHAERVRLQLQMGEGQARRRI
ncbi:Sir2 histone deacetylase Hst2, partial [Ascosphaera acerosa]